MDLIEAERCGDANDISEATRRLEEAKDRMGLVAAVLFGAAVGTFGNSNDCVLKSTWEAIRQKLGVHLFDSLFAQCNQAVQHAIGLCKRVYADNSALRQRMAELERKVDSLTPGIGDPTFAAKGIRR
jgi:tetrahydromethanopterin S-methyltransferase subunit G